MPIDLPKDTRAAAVASIERYAREHLDEPIGNIAAGGLLGFFLEEIGPLVYNQALLDLSERVQARLADLEIEMQQEPFTYWARHAKPARGKRS